MQHTLSRRPYEPQRSLHKKAFLLALGIAAIIFLPFVIMDKGMFIYFGDFNVQQIPFYKLAHEAVRSGDIFWNWYTDLGSNFVGSYSFYLLFSPFFWLTLPFPTEALPYLMAPLLVLKTACAALTSYLFLERFVKDKNYAVIGSLLYAFSGWMSFNIFFNHFHDVAVFFPLLLLGLEQLITEDKRGVFAIAVAINAAVNYWFFIGEVVFVILYVVVRSYSKGWRMTWKRFGFLAMEAVLGVLMAAVALLPSVLALLGNPRTDANRLLYGWGFWIYWHDSESYAERLFAIIQSWFFPPEVVSRPNFFPNHGAKWGSLSAWLPMVSMSGVIAYFSSRKNDWVKKLLALCAVMALIPGLNSLFILLNNSYYARWFYMPVLFMAMATVRAIEDSDRDQKSFRAGLKWTAIVCTVFAVACGLTPDLVDGEWRIGLADNLPQMWVWYGLAILGVLLTFIVVVRCRNNKNFQRILTASLSVFIIGFTVFYMANGKNSPERSAVVRETAIQGRYKLHLPDEPFGRADAYDDMDNLLMFWHLPNIQAFHSIVPVSIMEFYPDVGVKRDVGSRPEADYYAIRSLLSTRWLFISQDKKEQSPMPGWSLYDQQLGYNIYDNDNFIPMGFTYDYYVTDEQFLQVSKKLRGNLLLRAIHLDEEGIERNRDILQNLPDMEEQDFSEFSFERDVEDRNAMVAYDFAIDNLGFSAKTAFPEEELVFFSVPWEGGWSATVNSEPAVIERVNIGFMAVRVPAGEVEIRFNYMTPGLLIGLAVTGGAVVIFVLYILLMRRGAKKRNAQVKREKSVQQSLADGETVRLSWDEYLAEFDPVKRKERLRRAIGARKRHRIENAVPDEARFDFVPEDEAEEKEVETEIIVVDEIVVADAEPADSKDGDNV
ncbi:MAG: YfhO family protein [Oscillospiraceae bacterium]